MIKTVSDQNNIFTLSKKTSTPPVPAKDPDEDLKGNPA